MKEFLKHILFFAIFVGVILGSVYGVLPPQNVPVNAVGSMQIQASINGISLFQNSRGLYYTFSPFNDYLLNKNGKRVSLIPADELAQNNYTSSYPLSKIGLIIKSVKNYFGFENTGITFTDAKKITYTTATAHNNLEVTRSVSIPKSTEGKTFGTILSFNTNDFVYDQAGNLYNYVVPVALQTFQATYQIALTPQLDNIIIPVPYKTIFIYNPKVASVIVLHIKPNQTVKIDRNTRFIEVEETVKPDTSVYKTSMRISVFNDPKEARKSL